MNPQISTSIYRFSSKKLQIGLLKSVNKIVNLSYKLTSHIRSSEYSFSGSRFLRTVPSNIVGSCGMMLSLDRKSWRPILQISTSSITIVPSLGSTMRKRACINVDFPLPVRPTTPTFFLPGIVQVMFFKTDGRCSAYRTCTTQKVFQIKNKNAPGWV